MAIILEGSDQCPVIWGKLGPYQIHRTKQGKIYLKKWSQQKYSNSLAQQQSREAFSEGVIRWKSFEKNAFSDYWSEMAGIKKFVSGYHVFLSSFILIYKEKITELGSHADAMNYVKNTSNPIGYRDSTFKKQKEESAKLLNKAVLDYRKTESYKTLLNSSLEHLKTKGWLNKTRFGLTPYINSSEESNLKKIGIVPLDGGFGSFAFGRGTYGSAR